MRLFSSRMKRSPEKLSVRRELLKIDNRDVELRVRLNPRARRLIVKVHPSTGEVTVVAPRAKSLPAAIAFARGQAEWIARQLAHVPQPVSFMDGAVIPFRGVPHRIVFRKGREPIAAAEVAGEHVLYVSGQREHVSRRVTDFLKREARNILSERAVGHAAAIGAPRPARVSVRDTSSRWGSCSATRMLSFSWRLIFAPDFVLDYVVAHEVAHLLHMNHGPRFWAQTKKLVADIDTPQDWLRVNGAHLHRYG
jgi:predicted metal-dependent hydrolase